MDCSSSCGEVCRPGGGPTGRSSALVVSAGDPHAAPDRQRENAAARSARVGSRRRDEPGCWLRRVGGWRRRWQWGRRRHRHDHLMHEKDVAGAAGDHEEMEQLVSREHPGVDDRPVRQVDRRADAIKYPAQRQRQQRPVRVSPRQLSVTKQRTPSPSSGRPGSITRAAGCRRTRPAGADQGDGPDRRQSPPPPGPSHHGPGHRRVRPGDQQVDSHMVEPLEPASDSPLSWTAW